MDCELLRWRTFGIEMSEQQEGEEFDTLISTLSASLDACRKSIPDPMFPSKEKREEMVRILYNRAKCFEV